MLRSHLTLALRMLRRRKRYSIVNVLGLTVGLACCALVAVFLQHELTYDTHHDDADRIYRILTNFRSSTYSTIPFEGYNESIAPQQRALADRLPEAVAAIEQATNYRIEGVPFFAETEDGRKLEANRMLVSNTLPALFDVFTFERVAGNPLVSATQDPYSAVLSASTAERFFGERDPIGQTLTIDSLQVTVDAVVADPPSNSRIRFDVALQVKEIDSWGAFHYVRLAPGTDPASVVPQITQVMNEVHPRRVESEFDRRNRTGEELQALTRIHFAERALYDAFPHRNPAFLWAFALIGILILAITTINYANLALALYAGRTAEIGVRKAIGGYRAQIARQFLVEAAGLALACVPLALLLCRAVLPAFNGLMDLAIAAESLLQPSVVGAMVGLALITGLAAGGYPALVLARRQTVDLFDRSLSTGGSGSGWSLRHGLIGLQFVVLVGLGSLSWIAYDQLRYMQESDLGYRTENVVRIASFRADSAGYSQFRRRLLDSPAIRAAGTGVTPNPGANRSNYSTPGSDAVYKDFYTEPVDVGWFDAMGIEHPVVDRLREAGASAPERILINRAAAERFGFENPVGEKIILGPDYDEPIPLTVDGVLPNMHFRPMRQEVLPAVFRVRSEQTYTFGVVIRAADGQTQAALEHVRSIWPEVRPDTPLQLVPLSEQVSSLYDQERRFGALAASLAGIAIVLAAIGLASLVAYLTRLRLKEIGVRKSLGASTAGIVARMNVEYVQIVAVAFLVGAPLAWLAAEGWLSQFAYRVDVSPLPFLGTGLGALAVAVLAVSTQALRAARVSPADVLRAE